MDLAKLRYYLLPIALFFMLSETQAQAQMKKNESHTKWERFVHLDFELSMPVSKVNYRPLSVPIKASVAKQLLPSLTTYDLIEYQGANESFFCTVQLTVLDEPTNVEGVSTKLMQEIQLKYPEIQDKELVSDKIERQGAERKLQLVYAGNKEVYTIKAYVNDRRIILIMLSDVSKNQKWTKKFLENFQLL